MSINKVYVLRPSNQSKDKGKGNSISIPPEWIKKHELNYGDKLFVCADNLLIISNEKDSKAKYVASLITNYSEMYGVDYLIEILENVKKSS